MAYTAADLATIRAARVALAKGDRVRSVRFADGSLTEFADATEAGLQALENEVAGQIATTSTTRKRSFLVTTSKGL